MWGPFLWALFWDAWRCFQKLSSHSPWPQWCLLLKPFPWSFRWASLSHIIRVFDSKTITLYYSQLFHFWSWLHGLDQRKQSKVLRQNLLYLVTCPLAVFWTYQKVLMRIQQTKDGAKQVSRLLNAQKSHTRQWKSLHMFIICQWQSLIGRVAWINCVVCGSRNAHKASVAASRGRRWNGCICIHSIII